MEDRLCELVRLLGLRYGAVDLGAGPTASYVFLEVNPAGQWLFVELATGQPVSAALAGLLHQLDEEVRQRARRRRRNEVVPRSGRRAAVGA